MSAAVYSSPMSSAVKLMKLRNSGISLLFLIFVSAVAQAERLPLRAYTTADGLAHNVINKIVRDSRGFLWFCTEEGLSRFDGYGFTNYGTSEGLPHPGVNDILETRGGEYWVATTGGLVHFNPKGTPADHVVSANEAPRDAPPMFTLVVPEDTDRHARFITALLEGRDDTLWCGTLKGLYRLDASGGRFALSPVDLPIPGGYGEWRFVTALAEDRYGSLWVATHGGLYRRWADSSTARYSGREGLSDAVLHDLLIDHQGRLWVGSRFGGLFRLTFDGTHAAPALRNYTSKDGLGADWIFDLYESTDDRLWAGTNKGFCELVLNESGEVAQARAYNKNSGLSYQEIVSITSDRDGNLWLGTNNNGAMKLARPGFDTFDERDGLSQVTALFESNAGELYAHGEVLGDQRASVFEGAKLDLFNPNFSLYHRLGRFDGRRFDWFIPDALKKVGWSWSDRTLVLQARTGEWWLAMDPGLYLFSRADSPSALKAAHPIAVYTIKNDLEGKGEIFYCIYEDARGDLWIATVGSTGNGLFRWERATRTLHDLTESAGLPPLRDHLPAAFQKDAAGDLWIGFAQGELVRYAAGRFETFTAHDGLPGGGINALYLDRTGRLWSATTRGVCRIDAPAATRPAFVNYTTAQGLSGNVTYAVTEDSYGRIYVGTSQGLDQFNPANGRIKHYTTADGLAGGRIFAAMRDHDGRLWIGTTEGLSRFLPEPERSSPPPPVLLTGLQIAGTVQNISALGETELHVPDLAVSASQLQIDFVGLGFAPGESLRYQYMLEGADRAWSAPTAQRTVTYARLAAGRYRFLVRAVNADGQVSDKPAAITFRVLPPVWLRWWFIAFFIFALGGAAYALYRYRVVRLLEVANMRTRIATDLHDDIGANLTKIAILSEVAKQQQPGGNGKEDSPLSSIARISRESVASMNDIVWAIDPQRDHLIDLVRRMRREAEELFSARDIELTFQAPGDQQDLRLGVDVRRDLFLIFKEAINNAARHSQSHQVTIEFSVDPRSLALRITDNGTGFDLNADDEGHGLENMRQRAQALGGELTIDTGAGKGTIIDLKVPRAQSRRLFGEKSTAHPV